MAAERLSMRTIREVLRLKWEKGLTTTEVARSCNIARSTVREYVVRAEKAGLSWPLPPDIDDAWLEARLFPAQVGDASRQRDDLDMTAIHRELARKSVTLRLLWLEYKAANPDGYQYSQYCLLYRTWRRTLDVSLRQSHRAGEKLFVDYAGQTIPVTNPETGETSEAFLFVATLGASSYTFAWASLSCDLPSWIDANVRALEFFGGVPEIIVPDNLKTGVTKPCYYEPDINPTYHAMACHYGTVIIPTRVRKPKDKAKVESAVLIAERWIIAALRNHTFFGIDELNRAIAQKLPELNGRKFQKIDATRRSLFETVDRPALRPLPATPYDYAECKKVRASIDYHVEIDGHFYSVPYPLAKKQVEVWLTTSTVEILYKNRRVASHQRSYEPYGHTTVPDHMPSSHRKHLEWSPSRIVRWAERNGPCTRDLVAGIMERRRHPEQGFRSCLGIMRLATKYSPERLEAACSRALYLKAFSYKSVESILKNNLDSQPVEVPIDRGQPLVHYNIRGREFYRGKEDTHA